MNVLVLIVHGRVVYFINGEEVVAEKGDLLFIPQSTMKSSKNHTNGAHQKYTVLFFKQDQLETGIPFLDKKQFIKFKTENFEYIRRRFERLYMDLRGDKKYRFIICLGILQELLGMIARELETTKTSPMKLKYAQIIQQYLLENYRENIEIDELAKLIQKSSNYTISLFKEVTGYTPIKYIHQLRIIEACNLLLNSDMSIENISVYLGYYDTSYFSKTFKKLTSLSPKEFLIEGYQADMSTILP